MEVENVRQRNHRGSRSETNSYDVFPETKMGMNRKNSIDGLFPLHSERRLGAVATVSATIDQARLKERVL